MISFASLELIFLKGLWQKPHWARSVRVTLIARKAFFKVKNPRELLRAG